MKQPYFITFDSTHTSIKISEHVVVDRELAQDMHLHRISNAEHNKNLIFVVAKGVSFTSSARQYFFNTKIPHTADSVALVSNNRLMKLLFNIMIKMKKPVFPIKIFPTEKKAQQWIISLQ